MLAHTVRIDPTCAAVSCRCLSPSNSRVIHSACIIYSTSICMSLIARARVIANTYIACSAIPELWPCGQRACSTEHTETCKNATYNGFVHVGWEIDIGRSTACKLKRPPNVTSLFKKGPA
jgi:hypothetical protein